jgi:hypothetical protein
MMVGIDGIVNQPADVMQRRSIQPDVIEAPHKRDRR